MENAAIFVWTQDSRRELQGFLGRDFIAVWRFRAWSYRALRVPQQGASAYGDTPCRRWSHRRATRELGEVHGFLEAEDVSGGTEIL